MDEVVKVDAGPTLGRAGRLVAALRGAGDARRLVWSAPAEAANDHATGVVLLVPGGTPDERREATLADLLRAPVANAGLAASPDAAPWGELPDTILPDLVRDDHAAWLVATWASARGARVLVEGPYPAYGLAGAGRAWLAAEALRWIGPRLIDRDTLAAVRA